MGYSIYYSIYIVLMSSIHFAEKLSSYKGFVVYKFPQIKCTVLCQHGSLNGHLWGPMSFLFVELTPLCPWNTKPTSWTRIKTTNTKHLWWKMYYKLWVDTESQRCSLGWIYWQFLCDVNSDCGLAGTCEM